MRLARSPRCGFPRLLRYGESETHAALYRALHRLAGRPGRLWSRGVVDGLAHGTLDGGGRDNGPFLSAWRSFSATRTRALIAGGTFAALLLAVVLFGSMSDSIMSQRIQLLLPDLSARTLGRAWNELWERNRYGTSAVRMIVEHPLVGVGLGGFHTQVADAAYLDAGAGLPSDNAQNWFRHQLAELGLLGSAGWLVFCGSFLWMLVRKVPDDERWMAGAAKGSIVGLGMASLLGMPTQDVAVFFTFIVFVVGGPS